MKERSARARPYAVLTGVAIVTWATLVVLWLGRLGGRAQDDIFILYRYAWNLAHGHGLVYNVGERVFGLSEPGLALLLAALHRLTGVDAPTLGGALFGLSLLALASLLLAAALRAGRGLEAVAAGTLLLVWSQVWVSLGAGAEASGVRQICEVSS